MLQFDPVNQKTLEDIIQHLISSTCCLNVLSTDFLKGLSDHTALDLLQTVIITLLSGVFPQAIIATIEPLLKKNNQDPFLEDSFRLI